MIAWTKTDVIFQLTLPQLKYFGPYIQQRLVDIPTSMKNVYAANDDDDNGDDTEHYYYYYYYY